MLFVEEKKFKRNSSDARLYLAIVSFIFMLDFVQTENDTLLETTHTQPDCERYFRGSISKCPCARLWMMFLNCKRLVAALRLSFA